MGIYVITIIISVLLAYGLEHTSVSGKKIATWIKVSLVALPSILVTGFRYGIGTDYFTYKFAYGNPDFTNVVKYFELINRLYFKAIDRLGGDFNTAVFIASVIFFIIVYSQVFKESPYPWLSTFLMFGLLFFFVYMNVTRQMISIGLLLYSLKFIEKKKYIPFAIVILIAVGIHRASILFVLVLIFMRKEVKFRIVLWITPVVFLLSNFIGPLISRIASQLHYQTYLGGSEFTLRSFIGLTWQIVVTVVAYYTYDKFTSEEDQKKYSIFYSIQVLALWSNALIGFVLSNEISRVQLIFKFPSIIFIPMIINRLPRKHMKVMALILTIVYGLLNIYWLIYVNNEHGTLPYQTFFSMN